MEKTVVGKCPVAGLQDGDIRKCVGDKGRVIAVYRQDGRFYATQDRCSHALASLSEGWLEGHEVFCPVHEARFDIRSGKALCFPAADPIAVYDVALAENGTELEITERQE